MQHKFNFNGDAIEVTIARENDYWILDDMTAYVLKDGRIKLIMQNGNFKFAHSAKVGDVWWIHFDGHIFCLEKHEPGYSGSENDNAMTAPMPGKILEVFVERGQNVEAGQLLLVIEAMKMEHRILASIDGMVNVLNFQQGDQVQQGDTLVEIVEG